MKKLWLTAFTLALLTACASTPNNHFQAASIQNQADKWLSQIKQPQSKIVAYYDKDGKQTQQASAGGFYRVLLGQVKNGYIVQDFYQDSQSKQTNPILITKESDLTNFSASVNEGRTIWYSPEGKITQFADTQNGQNLAYGFYLNEQIANLTQVLPETKGEKSTFFYPNGKPMFIVSKNSPAADMVRQYYQENGQLLWDSSQSALPAADSDLSRQLEAISKRATEIIEQLQKTLP